MVCYICLEQEAGEVEDDGVTYYLCQNHLRKYLDGNCCIKLFIEENRENFGG